MRLSRGLGVVVLMLVGASGCAGVQSRTGWYSQSPQAGEPARSGRWFSRGWWSAPTPTSAQTETGEKLTPDLDAPRTASPETGIWPEPRTARFSRLIPMFRAQRRRKESGSRQPGPVDDHRLAGLSGRKPPGG